MPLGGRSARAPGQGQLRPRPRPLLGRRRDQRQRGGHHHALEQRLAPHFRLPLSRIAKPDYNVADRRALDWNGCDERAQAIYDTLVASLP
ncbi:MAG: hypothetical protein EOO75_15395 [Myxococcales bacterium]|nr:MAG: hypothetical protein EOO75_15395 [Myxococcales bacterium]